MAFTYVVTDPTMFGTKWIVTGTFDFEGATVTGEIVSGLRYVEVVLLTYTGNGVVASAASVDETLGLGSGTVTIDAPNTAEDGTFIIIGRL